MILRSQRRTGDRYCLTPTGRQSLAMLGIVESDGKSKTFYRDVNSALGIIGYF